LVNRHSATKEVIVENSTNQRVTDPERELADVLAFAKQAHGKQTRKHGAPYWEHPLAVCRILVDELGVTDRTASIAALLHDVVEDTPVPLTEIVTRYGNEVAEIVAALTKAELKPGEDKLSVNARYYAGLRDKPLVVRQIKVADRIHNLREMEYGTAEFRARYCKDTESLIAALEGTPGLEKLRHVFAEARRRTGA
jgi:GTP pyrophosphokinase